MAYIYEKLMAKTSDIFEFTFTPKIPKQRSAFVRDCAPVLLVILYKLRVLAAPVGIEPTTP